MRSSLVFILASVAAPILAEECSPLHYVYARATTEVPTGITEKTTPAEWKAAASKWWSLGYGAAGGALWLNLTSPAVKTQINGITGYAVPYPADATFSAGAGTRSSPQIGIDMMVAEIKTKSTACPKQKYILGGHSQGGGVTVGAIRRLSTELSKDAMERIIAVTMFGSPKCPDVVAGRCKSYCHKADFACDPAAKGNTPNLAGLLGKGKGLPPGSITPTRRSTSADEADACSDSVAETGYDPKVGSKTGSGPHLSYNADGYYIRAAACYIQKKYTGGK